MDVPKVIQNIVKSIPVPTLKKDKDA
jgi:hypothetical protein